MGGHGSGRAPEPEFDLDRGRITLGVERHILVPAAALFAMCHAAGERASRDLGRAVGGAVGRRLASAPAGRPDAAFDHAIDALGAELAWLGLGALSAERWGELLVLRLEGTPPGPAEVDAFLAGLVEAAIEAWTGRVAHAVVAERTGEGARLIVGGARVAGVAQGLVSAGAGLLEIVRHLHSPAPGGGGGGVPGGPA